MSSRTSRLLIIVDHGSPSLATYLTRAFAGEPLVSVIVDRRTAERRQRSQPIENERRMLDRRTIDIRDDMQVMGYAMLLAKPRTDAARWAKRNAATTLYPWRRTGAR